MLSRWIPWKFFVKRIARSYGFMDPFTLLARLRRFSQPSEVLEPLELLRAGIAFHARGLINTRAIQNNLDWVWPHWVEKQFNPEDPSFVPRAYSLTHVNLTHRNWTAVGQPDLPVYPLVDPRGLVTPLYDGWSLDFWVVGKDGDMLLPSKLKHVEQHLHMGPGLEVETRCRQGTLELNSCVRADFRNGSPWLIIQVKGASKENGWLAASLRPYNPEGIQFIEKIEFDSESPAWRVNSETRVEISERPKHVLYSTYENGDVIHRVGEEGFQSGIECKVGMATSAALFPLTDNGKKEIEFSVPLADELRRQFPRKKASEQNWESVFEDSAILQVPDSRIRFLFEAASRTLVLLSADDIFPGPYTYRRFWFRDACLMIHAMLSLGLTNRCFRLLNSFPPRQKRSGYFQSQEGEWDSNGQVLWIFDRFEQLTGRSTDPDWLGAVLKGADWIAKKRMQEGDSAHKGLLPAGFSAEHLGPNDYYYWDNFWALAGLRAATRIAHRSGSAESQQQFLKEADDLERSIFDSLAGIRSGRSNGAFPASPYRRMDSGAVGSLVADYPLQITAAGDPGIQKTVDFLMESCLHEGVFFQDMIHSGMNPYLTLCIAQTLLRAGDLRYRRLVEKVGALASPTGQWPEAVHPFSGGGCMGDGQHGWAAAEWVQVIRNLFVREENGKLILGSGLFPEWIQAPEDLFFGPTPTPYGDVTLRILKHRQRVLVEGQAAWRNHAPEMEIRIPGYEAKQIRDLEQTHPLKPLD